MSVLRGGSGNNSITINAGSKHIAIGDFGKDRYVLNGIGRLILRTDDGVESGDPSGAVQRNAAQNAAEADEIIGFTGGVDKAWVPGVGATGLLSAEQIGTDTYLKAQTFTNGTTGMRYIAKFVGKTKAEVEGFIVNNILVGATADQALAALTPNNFLADPTIGGIFN